MLEEMDLVDQRLGVQVLGVRRFKRHRGLRGLGVKEWSVTAHNTTWGFTPMQSIQAQLLQWRMYPAARKRNRSTASLKVPAQTSHTYPHQRVIAGLRKMWSLKGPNCTTAWFTTKESRKRVPTQTPGRI